MGLPPIQATAEELGELGAPEGDEEQIAAIIEGMEETVEASEEEPMSVIEGTGSGSGGPFDEVNKLAAKYGFKGLLGRALSLRFGSTAVASS